MLDNRFPVERTHHMVCCHNLKQKLARSVSCKRIFTVSSNLAVGFSFGSADSENTESSMVLHPEVLWCQFLCVSM